MSKLRFKNNNAAFFNALRERTDRYFKLNNIKQTGNFRLYLKTTILLSVLAVSYISLVFFTPQLVWISLSICVLMGITLAAIGFNVMHDGSHGSYSTKKWLNECMAYTLNIMGGNAFIWKHKHNINHHTFTNVEGHDDDIDIKPFIRVHESQKQYWFHKFQHIYCLFLYGFTYIFWVYYNDFKKYFSRRISDNTKINKISATEHFIFWFSKIGYTLVFIAVPIYYLGLVETLVGYGLMAFVSGIVIAVVFQLAHIVEDIEFVSPTASTTHVEADWAVHQLNTTVNFATKNKVVSWLLGGLNFQVEHHLFPRISHVHYPKVSRIVQKTCKEFNIAYREFPTMRGAFRSHLLHLKQVGAA